MAKTSGTTRSGSSSNPRGLAQSANGGGNLSTEDREWYSSSPESMGNDWYNNRRNAKGKAIEALAKEWHSDDMKSATTPKASSLKKDYDNGEQATYRVGVGNHTDLTLTREYDGTYYASVETAGFGTVQLNRGRWSTTLKDAKDRAVKAFDEYRKQKNHGRNMKFDY